MLRSQPIDLRENLRHLLSARGFITVFLFCVLAGSGVASQASPLNVHISPEQCADEPPFVATLRWDLGEDFSDRIEIRVDSPTGRLFSSGRGTGESTTGTWVRPGMRFYLVSADDEQVLGEVEASLDDCPGDENESDEQESVATPASVPEPIPEPPGRARQRERQPELSAPSSTPSARPPAILEPRGRIELDDGEYFKLSPPRLRYCGQPVEQAMVRVLWDVSGLGEERARVYLGSVGGQLLADGPARGEEITGEWVKDGMRFLLYLPDQDQVVAEKQFRILPCNVAEYPDEPAED